MSAATKEFLFNPGPAPPTATNETWVGIHARYRMRGDASRWVGILLVLSLSTFLR